MTLEEVLDDVDKQLEECFIGIEMDDYPEKYHNVVIMYLNNEISKEDAIAKY